MNESVVTARFYVSEMTRKAHDWAAATVVLAPAYRGEENKAWSKATPSGKIELSISNHDAVESFDDWFRDGNDIAITFTAVTKAEQTTA